MRYVFNANYWFSILYNMLGHHDQAYKAIKEMEIILDQKEHSFSEINFHTAELMCSEQKMVTLFLLGSYNQAKVVAQTHFDYPHRRIGRSENAAQYIISKCNGNESEILEHPEYERQFNDIVNGVRLWL